MKLDRWYTTRLPVLITPFMSLKGIMWIISVTTIITSVIQANTAWNVPYNPGKGQIDSMPAYTANYKLFRIYRHVC